PPRPTPCPSTTLFRSPGQASRPSTSRCSTTAALPPTVTNDASVRHCTALPWNPARDNGRAVAHHERAHTAAADEQGQPPSGCPSDRKSTRLNSSHVTS